MTNRHPPSSVGSISSFTSPQAHHCDNPALGFRCSAPDNQHLSTGWAGSRLLLHLFIQAMLHHHISVMLLISGSTKIKVLTAIIGQTTLLHHLCEPHQFILEFKQHMTVFFSTQSYLLNG